MCISPITIKDKQVPCGRCFECLEHKANEWAFRVMLECKDKDCFFLTLTYNDENLPKDKSVHKEEFQKFIKRVRKYINFNELKYIGCGEYGEFGFRPHYHLAMIGWCPDDLVESEHKGNFNSKTISKLWKFGFHTIEELNEFNCKYVCKYMLKEHLHIDSDEVYEYLKKSFNLVVEIKKPFFFHDVAKYRDKWYRTYKQHIFIQTQRKLVFGQNQKQVRDFLFRKKYGVLPPFFLCSKGIGYNYWLEHKNLDSGKIYYNGSYISIPRSFILKFEKDYVGDILEDVRKRRIDKLKLNQRTIEEQRQYRKAKVYSFKQRQTVRKYKKISKKQKYLKKSSFGQLLNRISQEND